MTTREMKMLIKLGECTAEYLALEREKEIYYVSHVKDLDRTTIITLYLMQKHIDGMIKKIIRLVDRLDRNGIDFDNEVATMVYNHYEPLIRRGLLEL